jgi:hypothetical protein
LLKSRVEFNIAPPRTAEMKSAVLKTLLVLTFGIGSDQALALNEKIKAEYREACPEYVEYSKYPQ